MNEYENLLSRAAECEQLAREVNDPAIREKLSELAANFQHLANQAKSLEDVALSLGSALGLF